jgi:hypothetical protein
MDECVRFNRLKQDQETIGNLSGLLYQKRYTPMNLQIYKVQYYLTEMF